MHVVASCSGEGVEWPKVKEQRGLSSRKVPALPEGSGPPLPVTPFFPESSAHSESLWVLPPFPAWLCTYQWKDTGSPVSGGQGHGHRALATSSGCSHLVAEPVTVGVFVNIHDDVIHLRDPHKPVALQEPGRGHSSAPEPVDLPSTGPAAVGTAPPSWLQAAQGRCRGISCGAGTRCPEQQVGPSEPFVMGPLDQSPHQHQHVGAQGLTSKSQAPDKGE